MSRAEPAAARPLELRALVGRDDAVIDDVGKELRVYRASRETRERRPLS